jgi:hypothetical protein
MAENARVGNGNGGYGCYRGKSVIEDDVIEELYCIIFLKPFVSF